MVCKFLKKYPEVPGWRKIRNWHNEMKNMMRVVGKKRRATVPLLAGRVIV